VHRIPFDRARPFRKPAQLLKGNPNMVEETMRISGGTMGIVTAIK